MKYRRYLLQSLFPPAMSLLLDLAVSAPAISEPSSVLIGIFSSVIWPSFFNSILPEVTCFYRVFSFF